MTTMKQLKAHVFVCTNTKEKSPSCGVKGSIELRTRLKERCQDPDLGWKGKVRINSAGCLGQCENGIACVVYPQQQWFMGLKYDEDEKVFGYLSTVLEDSSK